MELWFGITVLAAFLQNVRSLLQKRLTGVLSVNGATYVRFVYAVPFAALYAGFLWYGETPNVNSAFILYVVAGAVAQIVATACLLASFTTGNFAVGTAYSKTEAAQAALFGLLVLGDAISGWVVAGIAISLAGVILLSGHLRWQELTRPNRAMWLGLLSATAFAVSVIAFRGASLALDNGNYLQRAGLTVLVAVVLQTLMMTGYLQVREPGQVCAVARQWRRAVWIGAAGMLASAGWFTAITLQNAAVVRAVGQIELMFTAATSVWLLGERLRTREVVGMVLVVGGIWLLASAS